mmetsp:Transcript_9358/g.26955  ORF Transcript_9358/g.26955 Transcript_9358/m.26955 type:complete len:212 (-) Transcript_9358:167-802(-)
MRHGMRMPPTSATSPPAEPRRWRGSRRRPRASPTSSAAGRPATTRRRPRARPAWSLSRGPGASPWPLATAAVAAEGGEEAATRPPQQHKRLQTPSIWASTPAGRLRRGGRRWATRPPAATSDAPKPRWWRSCGRTGAPRGAYHLFDLAAGGSRPARYWPAIGSARQRPRTYPPSSCRSWWCSGHAARSALRSRCSLSPKRCRVAGRPTNQD